ncbi:S-layer protein [Bacillus sp. FSL R10-2780]|uniref:S-layer protein n=1 Tax=Bacillus sp. FSL R10-2780 TaxID=2954660 RepID=UPI0030FCA99A
MKKWLALFVFGIVSLFATSAYAESYETTKTLKVYESRSFNSPVKKELQPGEMVYVTNRHPNGWWKISGGFIAPEGAQVEINRTFEAFDWINMDSAKYVFGPQTVIARDGTLRGEILIDTYLGQKWTSVNGMPQIMKQNFAAYSSPEAKNPDAWFAPQTVNILQTKENGWSLINTYLGPKWIVRYPHVEHINRDFYAYNEPKYMHHGVKISAQSVRVLQQGENGWKKIKADVGEKWIAPQGSYYYVPNAFTAFDQPLGRAIGSFAPQTVFVVEESTTSFGWLKIKTYLGDSWIQTNRN